ncbi:hypothetical protein BKA65DRAFT_547156 [Rhexocercosporidium sp. MPI-PUGE-AT-0058]|nr:hypothetical protein BKA65DRAFT_547156 [Rhexocercosporidium sp. MPI-PUGE-AT-0058]
MDGLSVASGAIAVVSLALQIGNGIKKLCDFWDSVQDSPKEIRTIVKDLNIISNIIDDIREEAATSRPYSRALTSSLAALDACADSIQTLEEMIAGSQPGLASKKSKRTWAAVRFAWNADRLRKYQDVLCQMKMTLILARQNSIDRATIIRDETRQQDLATIAQGVTALLQQRSQATSTVASTESLNMNDHLKVLRDECRKTAAGMSNPVARLGFENLTQSALSHVSSGFGDKLPMNQAVDLPEIGVAPKLATAAAKKSAAIQYRSWIAYASIVRSPFGRLHIISRLSTPAEGNDAEDDVEVEDQFQTRLTFYPSRWLLRFGVSFGIQVVLSKSLEGLDCRIKSYRAVPDDALIFQVSERGDNEAIQRLFDIKQASPWDRNSEGFTPLFFAARARRLDTCHLLLSQGADIEARATNYVNGSVASWASLTYKDEYSMVKCEDHIDILRLFLTQFEFSDTMNCAGLLGLRRLLSTAKCSHASCPHVPGYSAAFYWALPLLSELIDRECQTMIEGIAFMLFQAMLAGNVESISILLPFILDMQGQQVHWWLSPAHELVFHTSRFGIRDSDRYLLARGDLDMHVIAVVEPSLIEEIYLNWTGVCGHTPTSLAMRYSSSFFHFRKLLVEEGYDIEKFIGDELHTSPLAEQGWTQATLHFLFETVFRPLEMKRCSACPRYGFPTDLGWLSALEELRSGNTKSARDILALRDQQLLDLPTPQGIVCRSCNLEAQKHEDDHDVSEEYDSPFLLPL